MKTKRRHELQTNALADRLGAMLIWVEERYKLAVGAAVLVAAAVVAYLALSRSTAEKTQTAWNEYFAAMASQNPDSMRKVAEDHSGTVAGTWARLWIADQDLRIGIDQLFRDRPQANDELRKAISSYELVLQQEIDSLLEQRARFGLARAYESLDRLDDARKAYQELADKSKWKPEPLYAKQAEARLADLNLPRTKAFYDWFASQDPRPSLQGGAGELPFSTPSLDAPLPEEPGALGPSAFDSLRGKGSPDDSSKGTDAGTTETSSEPAEPATNSPPAAEAPPSGEGTPSTSPETPSDKVPPQEPAPSTP